jgi:hypothetical protein
MKKSDLQKQFEEEQGREAVAEIPLRKFYLSDYGEWCERKVLKLMDKAEAYDRLMSGGKKTLKELANFLQRPIAIQPSRSGCVAIFANVPFLGETEWRGYWMSTIACDLDFSGDWKDSLTLPDGWEES